MAYTIIIILIFIVVYFVYTFIQRQRQFQELCSDEHLCEIRDVFDELYKEVWTTFLETQQKSNDRTEVLDEGDTGNAEAKYCVTSKNFLITYKLMSVTLQSKDKSQSKELLINHLSFSNVKEYFFPKNLVYMGMYFSILLDIKPENFDHTIHQANKGTSGFLFCKTPRTDGFETYQKDIFTILTEPLASSDSGTTIEEDQKQDQSDEVS